jgi:hypothetical protein
MKVFLIKNIKLLQLFLKIRIKAEGQFLLHFASVNLSEDLVARLETVLTAIVVTVLWRVGKVVVSLQMDGNSLRRLL